MNKKLLIPIVLFSILCLAASTLIDLAHQVKGVLPAANGGAGTVNGALKGNGSGAVSQAACADLSNAAASCSTDATNASNISSGILPQAQGGVPQVTTTGVGGFFAGNVYPTLGAVIGNTDVMASGNNVRVWQFVLPFAATVKTISVQISNTSSGQTANVGIYSSAGNKLIDSGTFSTTAAAVLTNTITPVTLQPGIYYFAWSVSDTTATLIGSASGSTTWFLIMENDGVKRAGLAANATSAGVLPSTLGAITNPTNVKNVPVAFMAP